jgi:NitT/TauT family transport system substrate-binding protein
MRDRKRGLGLRVSRGAAAAAAAALGCAALAACSSSATSAPAGGAGSAPASAAGSSAPGMTTVRVGANLNAGTLATYVGIDEGFFAKHNLDVKLTSVLNLTLIPSQLGKQFDFGQSVQPIAIHAAMSGLPVVVTGGGEVESPDFIDGGVIVKKSAGINNAKGLEGKKIAVLTATGNNAYALKYWMKSQGANPASVTLEVVAPNNMIAELAAGQVDAIYAVSPFAAQALGNSAYKMLVNPEIELGAEVSQGTVTISNKDWAASHKDVVLQFEEAQQDAIAWIKANPDKALTILDKYTGSKSAADTKLPTVTATENADDLQVWLKVMKEVVPGFSTTLTPTALIDQPIDTASYNPQP